MKTTATCPKCGTHIHSLVKSYISTQEVTVRHPKGNKFVLAEKLICETPEIDYVSAYYRCPLCEEAICSSDEIALEFLKGD